MEYLDVNVYRHRRRIERICSDRTAEVTTLEIAPESNLMTTPIRGTVTRLALSPRSVAFGAQEDVQRAVADLAVRRSPSDVGEAVAQKKTAGIVVVWEEVEAHPDLRVVGMTPVLAAVGGSGADFSLEIVHAADMAFDGSLRHEPETTVIRSQLATQAHVVLPWVYEVANSPTSDSSRKALLTLAREH